MNDKQAMQREASACRRIGMKKKVSFQLPLWNCTLLYRLTLIDEIETHDD